MAADYRALLDRELDEKYGEARPFDSLGYKQARALLRGDYREVDAISLAQQGHRNYAKRQLTWFGKDKEMILKKLEDNLNNYIIDTCVSILFSNLLCRNFFIFVK